METCGFWIVSAVAQKSKTSWSLEWKHAASDRRTILANMTRMNFFSDVKKDVRRVSLRWRRNESRVGEGGAGNVIRS